MNIKALRKRVDAIIKQVDERAGPGPEFALCENIALFSAAEQVAIEKDFEKIGDRFYTNGYLDLRELTEQERDRLHLWCLLYAALESGDGEQCAQYRRYLSWSWSDVVERFMALESKVREDEYATRDRVTYPLTPVNYRHLKQHCSYSLDAEDISRMRMWIDHYNQDQDGELCSA